MAPSRGTEPRPPLFAARRRFDPDDGDRWAGYVAWSGLSQLTEVVSLDTILCPVLPASLLPADWEHNVHADYQTFLFRSQAYLRARVAGEPRVNLLALLRNPSEGEVDAAALPGFRLAGFDLVDVHGDISALTNCGGFDRAFAGEAHAHRTEARGRYFETVYSPVRGPGGEVEAVAIITPTSTHKQVVLDAVGARDRRGFDSAREGRTRRGTSGCAARRTGSRIRRPTRIRRSPRRRLRRKLTFN